MLGYKVIHLYKGIQIESYWNIKINNNLINYQ